MPEDKPGDFRQSIDLDFAVAISAAWNWSHRD